MEPYCRAILLPYWDPSGTIVPLERQFLTISTINNLLYNKVIIKLITYKVLRGMAITFNCPFGLLMSWSYGQTFLPWLW